MISHFLISADVYPVTRQGKAAKPKGAPFIGSLLSFSRIPGSRQILSVKLFYLDGSTDELNITSPHVGHSEDIERQYIYIKKYLNNSAEDLQLKGYQASVGFWNGKIMTIGYSWPVMYVRNEMATVERKGEV